MKQCPNCLAPITSRDDVCKVVDIVCRDGTFEVVAKSVVCRVCGFVLIKKGDKNEKNEKL